MKLPRDIGGEELARLLERFGYKETRQTGSHLRLTSMFMGDEHHVTIPVHKPLATGTLNSIIHDVAGYLKKDRKSLIEELFQ